MPAFARGGKMCTQTHNCKLTLTQGGRELSDIPIREISFAHLLF